MYENNRRSSTRGDEDRRDFDDERSRRWRGDWSSAGRQGSTPFDDREARRQRPAQSGYGGTFRDDDMGRPYAQRGSDFDYDDRYRRDRSHWQDAQHGVAEHHHGPSHYGYGGRDEHPGDSSYFTGQQGSWAVRAPSGMSSAARGAGYGSFGDDYREHGYGRHERGFWDRATDEVASWFGDEDAAQRRERDHRGRGPKDYVRSDERIRDDANDRLTDDPRIDASEVTLSVDKGEITLDGTVGTREEKRRAEDVVENISGVKHVQNNLRVQLPRDMGHAGNWATNTASTAEGGTLSRDSTSTQAAKQGDKF